MNFELRPTANRDPNEFLVFQKRPADLKWMMRFSNTESDVRIEILDEHIAIYQRDGQMFADYPEAVNQKKLDKLVDRALVVYNKIKDAYRLPYTVTWHDDARTCCTVERANPSPS